MNVPCSSCGESREAHQTILILGKTWCPKCLTTEARAAGVNIKEFLSTPNPAVNCSPPHVLGECFRAECRDVKDLMVALDQSEKLRREASVAVLQALSEKGKLEASIRATPELVATLKEALELMEEEVNNRDGADIFDLSCANCEGGLPMKHSFGCRARNLIRRADLT